MYKLRFRQIHLDFHTSPAIAGIGVGFDKTQWQDALRAGHVNSITCFAKCHHGWSYHPTSVGKMHPHLAFDLLRAQMDACKEMDVNVPVYISAGVDNVASHDTPQWRQVGPDGRYSGWTSAPIDAGFHKMCFNSPYLDYLCEQIRETVALFPAANGVFLDIINQGQCCCPWCLDIMDREGLDARVEAHRCRCAEIGLERYYRDTTAAARCGDSAMPVFHNSGHIKRGDRRYLEYFSHLELESLPTGGWGYDHFPLSAKYCQNLEHDVMGMTGKFHTTWGEFGGYKHPNALRYECAAMLAYGSKCSVGDQLHPNGAMDRSTYEIIGAAYAEVEQKEPWCDDVTSVADIGLLSSAALGHHAAGRDDSADTGATRVLLEEHFLFDVLDADMDFDRYKVLVLPDEINVQGQLKGKLDSYLAQGGKLFLTGTSGIVDGTFAFALPAELVGAGEYQLDYVLPSPELCPSFCDSPLVMYLPAMRIKAEDGKGLGEVYEPYFDRDYRHFCSHQHTPPQPQSSGYHCGVFNGTNLLYLAHPVFTIYRGMGAVACREYIGNALQLLLGNDMTVQCNLPSTARVTLMRQEERQRYVLHLLYANTVSRGGAIQLGGTKTGQGRAVEVIEELLPLTDVAVEIKLPREVRTVTLEPQGETIPVLRENRELKLCLETLTCHQMIVFAE